MAEHLKRNLTFMRSFVSHRRSVTMKKMGLRTVTLSFFCIVPMVVGAENLIDPTRPPVSMGSMAQETDAAFASQSKLQSVLISPGRRVAMVSGKTVRVGDTVGDMRVLKIGESEVVLGSGKSVQTLKLFPALEKRQVAIQPALKSVVNSHTIKDK